jgi:CheY-like chemotaxis protein
MLIIDDSPADRASLRIAFEHAKTPLKLSFAESGDKALTMLRDASSAAQPWRPDLLFLDLNMPGLSGLELLRIVKSDQSLSTIPVIMFSGSEDEEDVNCAYAHHASGFIKKPPNMASLNAMADVVGAFCTSVLTFPTR